MQRLWTQGIDSLKTSIKVAIGILLAGLFLWLAVSEVELDKVIEASKGMSFLWMIPFLFIVLGSHFFRALRWRLLINSDTVQPARITLLSGIMLGYLANILFARLGEVTRPVYVARKIGESNSKLIGTVILERIIDTICLLFLMAFVLVFMVSDPEILHNLFGVDLTNSAFLMSFGWSALKIIAIVLVIIVALYIVLKMLSKKVKIVKKIFLKVRGIARTFIEGIFAIKELKNWPLFLLYTTLIWACYMLMTYIPFWMFNMQEVFGLNMGDALVLTMVSAVGIIIPTPGGIGTYHLFITKSLYLLYAVPETLGLAYATITHASTLVIIVVSTPILLAIDKFITLKNNPKS